MSKIGFISDLHSNLEALQAVLQRLDSLHIETILCLGDVVGYGASPLECIKLIQERQIPTVKGNHDDYVSDIFGELDKHLRKEVQDAIVWTQKRLGFDEVGWLSKLPTSLDFADFSILHSSYASTRWAYCLDEASFQLNFQRQKVHLAFCGHSHAPLIGSQQEGEEMPFVDYIHGQVVPSSGKVMVNVGSVGQPRDSDPRASLVLYDTESRSVEIERVDYDIAAAQQKIQKAGLSPRFAERLAVGR